MLEQAVLPLAGLGGLPWGTNPTLSDGGIISPVFDPSNIPNLLRDVAEILIQDGAQIDPRSALYYTQTAAMDEGCRRALLAGTTTGLFPLPTEMQQRSTAPGLFKLEMHKRELASRESAGDTWRRTMLMLLKFNKEEIYPKYAAAENPTDNYFRGEEPRAATGLPLHHACLGQATFFQMFQKQVDIVVPYYHPIMRQAVCWVSYIPPIPGITVAPVPPRFMVFSVPRWHTDRVSVPEGYHIDRFGEPYDALRP